MGSLYEDDNNVSILLRYCSDNDYPDMVFTNKPAKLSECIGSDLESPSPSPSPSPRIPKRVNSETKGSAIIKEEYHHYETNRLIDAKEAKDVKDFKKLEQMIPKDNKGTKDISKKSQSEDPLKHVACKLHNLDFKKLPRNLFKNKKLQVVEYKNGSGCFCWVSQCVKKVRKFTKFACSRSRASSGSRSPRLSGTRRSQLRSSTRSRSRSPSPKKNEARRRSDRLRLMRGNMVTRHLSRIPSLATQRRMSRGRGRQAESKFSKEIRGDYENKKRDKSPTRGDRPVCGRGSRGGRILRRLILKRGRIR